MGEAIVTGMIGGALGVALGYGGAGLVTALAPVLTASVGQSGGPAAQSAVRAATGAGEPVAVQLNAPAAPSVIVLAVVLAAAGGLVAGAVGGWRAARLPPAAALARVA
jgi:ABC-type antimicrobial peptide transport system permease subunit